MLIIGILGFGLLVGAIAQLLVSRMSRRSTGRSTGVYWGRALVAGLLGSFVGGLLVSVIAGDGLDLRPSGLVGSVVGAVLVTAVWGGLTARAD